jgi:hypothetical protein
VTFRVISNSKQLVNKLKVHAFRVSWPVAVTQLLKQSTSDPKLVGFKSFCCWHTERIAEKNALGFSPYFIMSGCLVAIIATVAF